MFPIRDLHKHLQISKASGYRVRREDPDYQELMIEYDVAGVTMGDEDRLEAYVARKRARAEAAKAAAAQPTKRRPGRPRKNLIAAEL